MRAGMSGDAGAGQATLAATRLGHSVMVILNKNIVSGISHHPCSGDDVCWCVCQKQPNARLNLLWRESLRKQMECDDEPGIIAPINDVKRNLIGNFCLDVSRERRGDGGVNRTSRQRAVNAQRSLASQLGK